MKNFLFIIMILFFSCNFLSARPKRDKIEIGGYAYTGGGINAKELEGIKQKPLFLGLSDIGASVSYIHNDLVGAILNIGYSKHGYSIYPHNVDSKYSADGSFSGISFNPSFYFGGFTVGINYTFVSSANVDLNVPLFDGGLQKRSQSITNDDLIELRLGGMIPIKTWKKNKICININAGYVIDGFEERDVLSLRFGFSYYFTVHKK